LADEDVDATTAQVQEDLDAMKQSMSGARRLLGASSDVDVDATTAEVQKDLDAMKQSMSGARRMLRAK
jgi:hypothetical protein